MGTEIICVWGGGSTKNIFCEHICGAPESNARPRVNVCARVCVSHKSSLKRVFVTEIVLSILTRHYEIFKTLKEEQHPHLLMIMGEEDQQVIRPQPAHHLTHKDCLQK